MAVIQNSAVIQKLIDELELSPALDKIPTELAEKILPVFQVNSEQLTISTPTANIVRSLRFPFHVTPATIFAVPATGKFYLTQVWVYPQLEDDLWWEMIVTIDG
ncbi:unnamed protein product, partial [marine sediment metagenome]